MSTPIELTFDRIEWHDYAVNIVDWVVYRRAVPHQSRFYLRAADLPTAHSDDDTSASEGFPSTLTLEVGE